MLTEGAIDIDTPIRDLRSRKIFFPEQHPTLRAALNPADIAVRSSILSRQRLEDAKPTMVYLHLRNSLIATGLGVLAIVALVLMLYPKSG